VDDRRVDRLDVQAIRAGMQADRHAGAAAWDAGAGHPHGKSVRVVVAAGAPSHSPNLPPQMTSVI
jgi:hypothetical protein